MISYDEIIELMVNSKNRIVYIVSNEQISSVKVTHVYLSCLNNNERAYSAEFRIQDCEDYNSLESYKDDLGDGDYIYNFYSSSGNLFVDKGLAEICWLNQIDEKIEELTNIKNQYFEIRGLE